MAGKVDTGDDDAISEINVTPMVDVLLCLLILFMVATPKPPGEKIPMNVPTAPKAINNADPNAILIVAIEADGSAMLGTVPLATSWEDMVAQLAASEKAQADGKIAIKANDKTAYGRVITIMAAAHEAGIGQVGIASERL